MTPTGYSRKFLLAFDRFDNIEQDLKLNPEYEIVDFIPSIFRLKLGECSSLKELMLHLMWFFNRRGRFRIFYVMHHGNVVHYSYLMPKFFKLSFMSRDDLHIGPCFTSPSYRGRGIYPYMVNHIVKRNFRRGRRFLAIVNENNVKSIKGLYKAGFAYVGDLEKDRFGIYRYAKEKGTVAFA